MRTGIETGTRPPLHSSLMARDKPRTWTTLWSFFVFIGTVIWVTAVFPPPAWLLSDVNHGFQLAGGMQILYGEHPFVTFREIYGPLVFYSSAAAQWLSGGRVLGELILLAVAYAITYTLLFRLMLALGVNTRIALVAIVVALALLPDFFRYYMVLTPAVFLTALYYYTSSPTLQRLLLLAATISLAGLFRPDIGIYALLACSVAVAHLNWMTARRYRSVVVLWAGVLTVSSPWLVWLTAQDSLMRYLTASSIDAIRTAAQLATPMPAFDPDRFFSSENARAYLARAPYVLVPLGLLFATLCWRQLPRPHRALILGLLGYASCSLLMISHRSDWAHSCDVFPVLIVVLTWCISQRAVLRRAVTPQAARLTWSAAVAAGLAMLVPLRWLKIERLDPAAVSQKLAVYSLNIDAVVAVVREQEPDNRDVRIITLIRQQTSESDRLFTLYGQPNLNYFSRRRFAGGQLGLFPGYFSSASQQQELVNILRRQSVGMVVINDHVLDNRPERALGVFAREVYDYLEQEFIQLDSLGTAKVLRPRNSDAQVNTVESPSHPSVSSLD